jgi:hypothetical protein
MSVPKYDASGVTAVTMDNGEFFPLRSDGYVAVQDSAQARGGQRKIAVWNPNDIPRSYRAVHRQVTESKKNDLLTFFNASNVNYMENEFEYYPDSTGASITVRLLEPQINIQETTLGRFDIVVKMRTVI